MIIITGQEYYENKIENKIKKRLETQPDYIEGYYYYISGMALSSREVYLNDVILFMNSCNKDVSELTFDDYSKYLNTIQRSNGKRTTASYQIEVYSALKKFAKYLYASKRVQDNIAEFLERPTFIETQETIQKREKGYLTEEELENYLLNVRCGVGTNRSIARQEAWRERDYCIITLFITTGIRCSAMSKLNVEDVNFETKSIHVNEKERRVREISISDSMCDIIKKWLEVREKLVDKTEQALFLSNQRIRITQASISRVVKKYCEGATDKQISPHKLRATYGTNLYNKTKDLNLVQTQMGHVNPQVTTRYIRTDKYEKGKRAADIMASFI